jgi:hypothetical protein
MPILGTREGDAAAAQQLLTSLEQRIGNARTPQDRADDYISLTKAEEQVQRAIAEPDPNGSLSFLTSHGVCAPAISVPSSDDFASNRSALQSLLSGADSVSQSALTTLAREANPTWAADHRSGNPGSEMIARTRTAILRGKRFPEIRHDEDLAYRNTPGVGEQHRGEIAKLVDAALAAQHRGRPSGEVRGRAMAAAMEAWKRGEDDAAIRKAADEAWPHAASLDRARVYMQQPTEWQCAPTSLTMAEASWGVAPSNAHTLARLTRELGDSPDYGLPGNASLIADQARRDGLQAVYNASPEASAVRAALRQGRTVVLNGSLGVGGHFIYIAGLRRDGSFIVDDPFRPDVTRFNDAELNQFTHDGPNPPGFAEFWK